MVVITFFVTDTRKQKNFAVRRVVVGIVFFNVYYNILVTNV
jgi:hypothetical protein